jgi:pyridoxamine 5'-phosphate oxidase
MTREEIFETMQSNPAFHLATAEGDQPHVRGMLLYKADQKGIIFHTGTIKDLYSQIENNPKAELCFNDYKKGLQIRVRGTLTEIKDTVLKDEITAHPTRAFLREWKNSGELSDFYNSFAVFCLKAGEATTWTMAENFVYPKTVVKL